MSANTVTKRFSAMNVGCPWRGVLPVVSGTIDAVARATVMFLYAGLALAISSPYVGSLEREGTQERSPHLWPLPHVSDRGSTVQEDQEELAEMVRIYFEWRAR